MKIVALDERERAAYGPRTLKEPGSPDWCWQTLQGLIADYKRIEERFHDVENTVSEIKKYQIWEKIPTDHPYGSFDAMLKAELQIDSKKLESQINDLRIRNQRLDAITPDLKEPHRPKKEEKGSDKKNCTTVIGRGNAYAIARLRKDRPGIHARVLAGELTVHAGMVEAGFRNKPPSKKKTILEKIQKLLPLLSPTDLQKLKDMLQ